jgi:hypothetical protein
MTFFKRFRATIVVGVALALALAAGGVSLASATASRSSHRLHSSQRISRAFVARFERQVARRLRRFLVVSGRPRPLPTVLVRNFRVFRPASRATARAASDPAGQFPGVSPDLVSQWVLAVGDSVQITNNVPGLNLWLIPGSTGTCFMMTTKSNPLPVGGCGSNSRAVAGEQMMALESPAGYPGGEVVIGLAPNGNTSVTLTRADGSTESVPVAQNVYVAETAQQIKSVSVRDSAGNLRSLGNPGSLAPPS